MHYLLFMEFLFANICASNFLAAQGTFLSYLRARKCRILLKGKPCTHISIPDDCETGHKRIIKDFFLLIVVVRYGEHVMVYNKIDQDQCPR